MYGQENIKDIIVGERHRKDLGDITRLAESIKQVGLLQPVVITPDKKLIAGRRRLKACETLGWEEVPVRVVDVVTAARALDGNQDACIGRGEFAENTCRKDFSVSEKVAIAEAVRDAEQELAQVRQRIGRILGGKARQGKKVESCHRPERAKTRDRLGTLCGMSGRTLEKAAAVVKAASQKPEKYGDLLEEMDRTNKVNKFFKRLQRREAAEQVATRKPIVSNEFRLNEVVCADVLEMLPKIKDETFDAVILDPPYGIGFVYNGVREVADNAQDYWTWFEPIYKELMRVLKPGGLFACWMTYNYLPHAWEWFGKDITLYASCRKMLALCRDTPIHWAYEPIILRHKPGEKPMRPVNQIRSMNWFVSSQEIEPLAKNHPCPKPLDQCEVLVGSYVVEGGFVFEPFAGTAPICCACKKLGRQFLGIERDRSYVELAQKRLLTVEQPANAPHNDEDEDWGDPTPDDDEDWAA